MKVKITQKFLFLTFIILVAIWITGYAVYKSNQKLLTSEEMQLHTQQVIYESVNILSLAKDIEVAARNFSTTGDSQFLRPLDTTQQIIFRNIRHLRLLTKENLSQHERIDSLELYIRRRLDFSKEVMEHRQHNAQLVVLQLNAAKEDKYFTDQIEHITDDIQVDEKELLQEREQTKTNEKSMTLFNRFSVVMFILMVVFTFVLFVATGNYLREQQRHAQQIHAANEELTEVNTALEAFSYSVSHDLRSPVRSLIGFAKIINKEYLHVMNKGLRELFGHIESSSMRMSATIDGLLALAKSGKRKLEVKEVDMTELFKSAWDDLLLASSSRPEFDLQKMPIVLADEVLLQQVVVNLLSNAVKYSAKKEHPHVQVGYTDAKGKIVVYVKDNGAGFDMKFYDRLFGAFERLHGMSEFDGTGVGLMLVKRIINRHGGEIWAEAKVGEGATFYFTLPSKTVL